MWGGSESRRTEEGPKGMKKTPNIVGRGDTGELGLDGSRYKNRKNWHIGREKSRTKQHTSAHPPLTWCASSDPTHFLPDI